MAVGCHLQERLFETQWALLISVNAAHSFLVAVAPLSEDERMGCKEIK